MYVVIWTNSYTGRAEVDGPYFTCKGAQAFTARMASAGCPDEMDIRKPGKMFGGTTEHIFAAIIKCRKLLAGLKWRSLVCCTFRRPFEREYFYFYARVWRLTFLLSNFGGITVDLKWFPART